MTDDIRNQAGTEGDVADGGFDYAEILRSARHLADVLRRLCPIKGQEPTSAPGGWSACYDSMEIGNAMSWLEGQLDPLDQVRRVAPDHIIDTQVAERARFCAPLVRLWEVYHKHLFPALYPPRKFCRSIPPVYPPVEMPAALPGEMPAIEAGLITLLERAADELERVLEPEVRTSFEQTTTGTEDAPPLEATKTYLTSWSEILATLKLRKGDRDKVAKLNELYGGPIVPGGRGEQPMVEKGELLSWHEGLADRLRELQKRRADRQASAMDGHEYGRDGVVAFGGTGAVKKRRRDGTT